MSSYPVLHESISACWSSESADVVTCKSNSHLLIVTILTGTDLNNIDRGDFSQLTPWRSQETYDMIIRAGHDGAKALVGSPEGHLLKTIQNVFIRVDIVLAAHWLTDDEVALVPMINEMDWLNSAGMLATFWKDPSVLYDMEGVDDNDMNGVLYHLLQKSPGYKIAKALHAEVLRVWRAREWGPHDHRL